jgi:hypothetical protein
VCFPQREEVEKVGGGSGIDQTRVLVTAVIADHDRWQPDDIEFPHVRIAVINAQRNERLRNGGNDGGVWIHHGIQQFAAYSVIFFDVDQEQTSLLPGAAGGLIPFVQPVDA